MTSTAPSLNDRTIAFVGAGNMAEALIRGLLGSHLVTPDKIVGTGRRRERLVDLEQRWGIRTSLDNASAVRDADVAIIAVKPQIFARILGEIAGALQGNALVISVAAGVPTSLIESHLRPGARVCRAMPNTPAVVGMGATAISQGQHATAADMHMASAIFSAVGIVTDVDEQLLDAVTGLSGSGPAYVFMIIEALADAGVKVGLPRYKAQMLAAQTVVGAASMLIETKEHPGVLKDQVTSPGGTAIAGLHTLEAGGLRTTLINAVEAATARSAELGELMRRVQKV